MAAKDFTPGFTTASQADLMASLVLMAGRAEQTAATGLQKPDPREQIPVSVTSRDSGTGYYAWTEQMFGANGARVTRPSGRTGTATANPLRLLGNPVMTEFPFEAWIIRCVGTATKGVVYEGIASGLADVQEIELDYIAKACVTRSYGVFQDITFEHRKIRILGVPLSDETYCTDGDEDCCPTVTAPCCDEPLPRCFKVTLSNGTGYWSCLDGVVFYLVYDDELGYWDGGVADLSGCVHTGTLQIVSRLYCDGEGLGPLRFRFEIFADADPSSVGVAWCGGVVGQGTLSAAYFCGAEPGHQHTVEGLELSCDVDNDFSSETGTIDLVVEVADCDEVGDGGGGGGGPGTGICCTDASLVLAVNGTGDFDDYADVVFMTYDPTGISGHLTSGTAPVYDGRFQWHGVIAGFAGTRMYFGCLDGVYHIGFEAAGGDSHSLPESACFTWDTTSGNGVWVSKIVTPSVNACTNAIAANITLTGNGTTGCAGTLEFLITRSI